MKSMQSRQIALLVTGVSCLACTALIAGRPGQVTLGRGAPAAAAAVQGAAQQARAAEVQWLTDLRTAHAVAVRDDRPMIIVFGAEWCGFCKKMERETFTDGEVASQLQADFVPVHLDFDKDSRVAEILEVGAIPCTVVLSPRADLLSRTVGYRTVPQLKRQLQESLLAQEKLEQASYQTPAVRR